MKVRGKKEKEKPKSKESKKPDTEPQEAVSPEQKRKLEDEAVIEIRQGVTKSGVQKAGAPFVPPGWSEKYKAALGPYKQFLKQHADKFVLLDDQKGGFMIRLPDQLEPPSIPDKKVWEKHILKAWMEYCKVVPRDERDFRGGFLAVLPKSARVGPKSPKSQPQSPVMVPKSPCLTATSPSLGPAKVTGKRKASQDGAAKKKAKQ
ncbi:unnamed protein product [Effrenium voratum]|nr:unnamed protein product [Effrenium voratum]